jgi:hypothetical protein
LDRFKPEEITVRPQLVRPADIVANVFADNEHDAAAKGLRLENAIDDSLKVQIDPELFLDAISNLIQNAVKYTTSGFVRVESHEQEDDIVFSNRFRQRCTCGTSKDFVSDVSTGTGSWRRYRFDYRSASRCCPGGTVGVESTPGAGSVFWFRLPRVVGARGRRGLRTAVRSHHAALRVWINRKRHDRCRQEWHRKGLTRKNTSFCKNRGREDCISRALHSGQWSPWQYFIDPFYRGHGGYALLHTGWVYSKWSISVCAFCAPE